MPSGHWYGKRPEVFENRDLDLAVATGAAYYSYVRSTGSGVLVRGGLPRTYFIGIGDTTAVCLVPRGAEEGATLEIDNEALQLVANKPVSFRLYSSLTRSEDQLGDVVEFPALGPDLHTHAPLNAVIRFGKKAGERLIPVKLGARLTEIGTLETWCESKISENRWRLQFELRKAAAQHRRAQARGRDRRAGAEGCAGADSGGLFPAREIAHRARRTARQAGADSGAGQEFLAAGRDPPTGRRISSGSRRTQEEPRLRSALAEPGRLLPAPRLRLSRRRFPHRAGAAHLLGAASNTRNQVQCEIDWWIFWGRLAGGMNRNQQNDIYQRLSGVPAAARRQEAAPQQQPAARDVAHGRQPGTAADRHESRSWATRWCAASKPAISARASSGACRAWARASCSMGRSIRWFRRPRRAAGPKRYCLWISPESATPWRPSRAAPKIPRATWPQATLAAVRRKLESLPHAERYLAMLKATKSATSALSAAFSAKNCPPA